ncbi:MAG: toprim domain-containing protein [Kiritimatiellia bacterium]|jgi:topoisomerase-4 subunit B
MAEPRKTTSRKGVYDEDSIKQLSSLEHIRLRTGMYIGRLGNGDDYNDGIYVLLKEVVDNAIDEFISGFGRRIEITLKENIVACRDYGRGIPLGKLKACVSDMNTGGKFNDDVFQYSVGMNGVGTKAVNALSSRFKARAVRDGQFAEVRFERGVLVEETAGATDERNGTRVVFEPDTEIFGGYEFLQEHVERRIRLYAYLNAGLSIIYNGVAFRSGDGLLDLLNDEVQFEKLYQPLHFREKTLEFAFTHTNRFTEEYFSFVNGQYTNDGGTHLSAFREGVLKAVNEYSPKTKFDGDDVREGLVGAIAIKLKDPIFESQTKNKLGNTEIRSDLVAAVRQAVFELLNRNPATAEKLVQKIEETRDLRRQLNSIKKTARERSKAVSIRIRQLKDSKTHLDAAKGKGLDTMIFICEGLSAAGTLTQARQPDTQAVFSLRGKPLNTCDLKRDAIYKNEELYNLMCALNIADGIEGLRYQKVILATDADVDGLHIRNLMITYFMRFFEPLVRKGHLYILETPLFRVRTAGKKAQTHYCYTEAERLDAIAKCGGNPEITRFKGLGEVNTDEFKDFIGENMRLTPVDASRDVHLHDTIQFYMGSNTAERRAYIMDNLVIDMEAIS